MKFLFIFLLPLQLLATDYYVSNSGNNSNSNKRRQQQQQPPSQTPPAPQRRQVQQQQPGKQQQQQHQQPASSSSASRRELLFLCNDMRMFVLTETPLDHYLRRKPGACVCACVRAAARVCLVEVWEADKRVALC